MLEQVEERLLPPLNVVEDRDQRGVLFEELAERPGDLLGGRHHVRPAEQRTDRRSGRLVRGRRTELLEDFDDGPVGDPLAVGEAAALDEPGLEGGERLRDEARFADARLADDRHKFAAPLRQRSLPRLFDRGELPLAPHEARLGAALWRLAYAK